MSPAWLALGLLGIGCGEESGPGLAVYADLAASVSQQEVLEGQPIRQYVWNLSGDQRPVLGQHPPSRVALTPVLPGSRCRLRVGLGIREPAWSQSDGVTFRLSLKTGEVLFEEFLDPTLHEGARWLDREVTLPASAAGSALVFETDPGPEGRVEFDHAGWAAPHLVCHRDGVFRRPPAARPDVILVSIDTLRRDHLGTYGYRRPTSPAIDALAREGLVFTEAFAPAPWTLPSHASLFTGLPPREHGAGHAGTHVPLAAGPATLAEVLADAGYRTIGFSAGGIMSRRFGLDRGFESWTEYTRANLRAVLPLVFAALGSEPREPIFLFLHTYDVHGPYAEWPGRRAFEPDSRDPDVSPEAWRRLLSIPVLDYLALDRFQGLSDVVAAYDSGIRHVDEQLGNLFARLRELGIYDRALIVVTSDHGESLHEHGLYIGHSYSLHDEEIRIPLVVRLPGETRKGESAELVELADLMPMILEVADVAVPAGVSGRNPLRRIDGLEAPRTFVEGESAHTGARYIRSSHWKLVTPAHPPDREHRAIPRGLRDRFDAGAQLYDVAGDPGERRNRWDSDAELPPEAQRLRRVVDSRSAPGTLPEDTSKFGEELISELRQLGYVQ